ncbi:MAG TPA: AAA family ATPase [Ilumatobacter sp.]|nr:AAA family ATPase [Ilumatobacter sp.]
MAVATRWPLVGRRDELDGFHRALTDPGCEGFCVYGPPGVGKTRLGDECLDRARAAGRRAMRASGDPSGEGLPFGAVAHLLPAHALEGLSGESFDAALFARLLETAREVLAPAADESGAPVLLVDDAHALDASSVAIVDRLMSQGALFCIATVVVGAQAPDAVTRWWRDERSARVDLAELTEIDVDTLLHIALEGPLTAEAAAALWRASRGNVLALRELVLGARAENTLVQRDDIWTLRGELRPPQRLRELIEARIARLDAPGRAALERLSLCQPLALARLEAETGLAVLEELDLDGLIAVTRDGRRETVRLAHPLHGEVLRAAITPLRRRAVLLAEAEAIETHGARRREDPIRIATWRLEATGRADPALLLAAARLARYDHNFRRAADLSRAALAAEPSASAGLVLGEALYNLGSFDEAERILAAASGLAGDDELVARLTTVRRRNLFRGLRREADATAVAEQALARLRARTAVDEVRAGEAEVLAISGLPQQAFTVVATIDATTPRLRVLAAIPRAIALAMTGQTSEAIALSEQAFEEHLALGEDLGIAAPGTHLVNQQFAMSQAGRLDEADAKGRQWFEVAARSRIPLGVMWIGLHLARCAVLRGQPRSALEWARRVRSAIDTSGLEGLRPATDAAAAMAHGVLGDAESSARCADQVDGATTGFGYLAPELPLARAWALIAAGQYDPARRLLVEAAESAEQLAHLPAAAWLLHDAARIGAADVAGRIESIASRCDSELVAARAAHAAALSAVDTWQLAAAGERFAKIGARLLAAEAFAVAADASRRDREQRRAAALDQRAGELVAQCEGAITASLAGAGTVVPLTEREREIAVLAAAGQSSRAIAEGLFLSVRTIDNHLGRVYDKLGVSNRAELASVLDRTRGDR